MSMVIHVQFQGDVDRLPHKDLAEKIIRKVNEMVAEAAGEAEPRREVGYAEHRMSSFRQFIGNQPYSKQYDEGVFVDVSWSVHIDG